MMLQQPLGAAIVGEPFHRAVRLRAERVTIARTAHCRRERRAESRAKSQRARRRNPSFALRVQRVPYSFSRNSTERKETMNGAMRSKLFPTLILAGLTIAAGCEAPKDTGKKKSKSVEERYDRDGPGVVFDDEEHKHHAELYRD